MTSTSVGGFDQAEMDVQAMRESQRGAGTQIALDVVLVDRGLMLVRREDHEHVGPLCRVCIGEDLEAGAFRLLGRGRAGAQRDRDLCNAAVAQILRVGVALAAIAEDGDLLALDEPDVGVAIVINTHV